MPPESPVPIHYNEGVSVLIPTVIEDSNHGERAYDTLLAPPPRPSRMRIPEAICLLGIIGLSAGCSTVVSKAGLDPSIEVQIGNPYSGIRFNLKSWRCLPSVTKGYSPALKLLFLPVSAALLLVDLPVSAAADTAMFPVDFMVVPRAKPIGPLEDECD